MSECGRALISETALCCIFKAGAIFPATTMTAESEYYVAYEQKTNSAGVYYMEHTAYEDRRSCRHAHSTSSNVNRWQWRECVVADKGNVNVGGAGEDDC